MKYTDRKGNIFVEETSQDKFLRHLYNDRGGRAVLRLLVRPVVSKAGGLFLSGRVSKRLIEPFIRRNHIDMSEYEETEYPSYNAFFTRKIKPSMRPIAGGEDVIISPCDGKLSVMKVGLDSRLMIKDMEYTLEQLLGSRLLAEKFAGGMIFIIRLTVDNYHRYCYPVSGRKSAQVSIPGIFHTVNPAAGEVFPIYARNHREFCLIKTENAGCVLQMEVGALMVGKITNYEKNGCIVGKGREKGRFEFGGSTMILLFQNGRIRVDEDLLYYTESGYETIVKMGERIGKSKKLSKGTGPAD